MLTSNSIQQLDERLLEAVVAHRRAAVDAPARLVASVGPGGLVWAAFATAARLRRDPGRETPLLAVCATVGGVYGGSLLLARVLKRDRPCHQNRVKPLLECPDGPSFPSDQTAAAFAGATLLAQALPEARAPLYAAAALIAAARVSCGVHWPSDVACAAAGGSAAAVVAARSRGSRDGRGGSGIA